MFGYGQKEEVIDRRSSLGAVPVCNNGVSVSRTGEDAVTLTVPIARRGGMLARFFPPVMEKKIKLDEIGSFVFGRIDGDRDVLGIVDDFTDRYRMNRREAELSTVAFLRSLVQKGAISLVVRGKGAAKAGT